MKTFGDHNDDAIDAQLEVDELSEALMSAEMRLTSSLDQMKAEDQRVEAGMRLVAGIGELDGSEI